MKRNLFFLLIGTFYVLCKPASGQSIVNVNPLKGTATVDIPIYTISSGMASLPVSLSYNSGIKPLDVEGTAGMGWEIISGGQISRSVRGLPDDVTKDVAGNTRLGWISTSNTAANAINTFSIQNNGGVTCSNETADITNITSTFPFNLDTEPDMFYVNAPGLSCELLYNKSIAKFVPVSYNDLAIAFTTDPTSGLITSFTITNNKGIKYTFAAVEAVKQTTVGGTPTYFSNRYKQYQYGINYSDGWYLTSLTDAVGNSVILTYNNDYPRSSTNPVSLYVPGSTIPTLQYNIQQSVTMPLLSNIKTNDVNAVNQNLSFMWDKGSTNQSYVKNIQGMGRNFQLNYSWVSSANSTYTRSFLRSFIDNGCATPINYQFSYGGEILSSGNYTTILPDSSAVKVDYWGYAAFNSNTSLQPKVWINPANQAYQRYAIYNPVTGGASYVYSTSNGNDRSAELNNFLVGNLVSIAYASGGTTTIGYEPNTYVDVPSGNVIAGSGVRVKQINDYDGNNVSKIIVRSYTYNDPSTGLTTGKPISLPVFAFTIPYSGAATGSSLWTNNTVLSDYDLSNEDHSILYTYSKVSQSGAGSVQYQFYTPATNWDNTATPDCSTVVEWLPTINYVARNNCTSTYGPINNSSYSYPFIPNANYDFERGMLRSVTSYNDANAPVSESDYTYRRSFTPSIIAAFKYEDNSNSSLLVRSYNKYNIYYNTSELTATVNRKVFDSQGLNQSQSSTVNYSYNSTQHKLLTQQSVINSDNSTVVTNIKYIKDYTASAGSNPNVNAIFYLQQQNINRPVETWQQVIRGGVTKTTGASLTLFNGFSIGSNILYLPSQQREFVQSDGVTDFSPYTISGQVSNPDSRYFPITNYNSYDYTGFPLTVDNANKVTTATILDHSTGRLTAAFANAAYGEIAFSDFDTDNASPQTCSFAINGNGSFIPNGSHTGNAYGLGTNQNITKTITARNQSALNYIFSIWINAAIGGNLTITLTGAPAPFIKSFAGGGWTYYEWKLPVSALPTSLTVNVTSNQAISIDDILFYPDVAQVRTTAYDAQNFTLTAETNTNGVSSYYQRDLWGRLLFQFDQDKNIIKKRSYFTPAALAQGIVIPAVSPTSGIIVLASSNFTANSTSCVAGVTYSWNFGDGTATVTALNGNIQSHTYANTGNYIITVTASHPNLGSQSSTQTIVVSPPPLTPQVCQSGVTLWNNCTNTATRTVACGSNPNDNITSYFTVTSVAGSGYGTLSYSWQTSSDNGVTWGNATGIGTTTGTQLAVDCERGSQSYIVRCVVTSTSGQTGTSATLGFSAPPCNP